MLRLTVIALCAVVLASSFPLALYAGLLPHFKPDERPAMALMGFEIVVSVTSVLGLIWSRGPRSPRANRDSGPALGLACLAGTILIASALGWQSTNRNIAGHSLTPLLGVRILISLVMLAAAAIMVLKRNRASWRLVFLGVAMLAPVVLLAAVFLYSKTRLMIDHMMTNTIAAIALATIGFLGSVLLISFGGHCLIRAFELGRTDSRS